MKNWVVQRSARNAADVASSNHMYRRSNVNKTPRTIRSRVYGPPAPPDRAAQGIEEILGPADKPKSSKSKGSK